MAALYRLALILSPVGFKFPPEATRMFSKELIILICIFPVLWSFLIVLCRTVVRNDLLDRLCQPINVRWRPFESSQSRCAFKVVYSDAQGRIHQAVCVTNWYGGMITWFDDKIVGETPDTVD